MQIKRYLWGFIVGLGIIGAVLLYLFNTKIGLLFLLAALALSLYASKGSFFKRPKKSNTKKQPEHES